MPIDDRLRDKTIATTPVGSVAPRLTDGLIANTPDPTMPVGAGPGRPDFVSAIFAQQGVTQGSGGGGTVPTVTISGTPQVGQTLTASESSNWSVGGVARNFLAASTTYVPVPGDVGKTVTATGVSSGTTSAATAAVANAALPAVSPTLATGAKTVYLGDSIFQQNSQGIVISGDATNGSVSTTQIGEFVQLLALEPRINADNWFDQNKTSANGFQGRLTNGANQGIKNNTSTQAANRVSSDVLSLTFDLAVLNFGTNNAAQRAAVLSDYQSAVTAIRNAGKAVIVGTIRPNGVQALADILAINASLRSYVAGLNDPLVVLWDAFKQYDRGDGKAETLDMYDGSTHPNARGAELSQWGNDPANPAPDSLAFAIRRLVQPGNRTTDILAAGTNFLPNPNFATTTGGALDTGVTSGTVPSAWRFGRKTSSHLSTAAISYEANAATGGNSMVIDYTAQGTNAGEQFDLYTFQINKSDFAGQWVRAFMEIETDGKPWLVPGPMGVNFFEGGTATSYISAFGPDINAPQLQRPVPRRRRVMSEPVLLRAGATAYAPKLSVNVLANQTTPGDTTRVKIHRVWASIVPNPKTAWGQ